MNIENFLFLGVLGNGIPEELSASLRESTSQLNNSTEILEKTHASREKELSDIAENEEKLKHLEAELTAINNDILALRRSIRILPEENIKHLIDDVVRAEFFNVTRFK